MYNKIIVDVHTCLHNVSQIILALIVTDEYLVNMDRTNDLYEKWWIFEGLMLLSTYGPRQAYYKIREMLAISGIVTYKGRDSISIGYHNKFFTR